MKGTLNQQHTNQTAQCTPSGSSTPRPAPPHLAARCSAQMVHPPPRPTWLPAVVHRWYTMVALVTVLPVPGGPCMRDRGCCSTLRTACNWLWLSSGRFGALKPVLGSGILSVMGSS
jgi:hypothetical protein